MWTLKFIILAIFNNIENYDTMLSENCRIIYIWMILVILKVYMHKTERQYNKIVIVAILGGLWVVFISLSIYFYNSNFLMLKKEHWN